MAEVGTLNVDALYEAHAGSVTRYLARRLGSRAGEADDLMHDVFEKAVRKAHTYEDRGLPVESWLYRIAHNALVDHLRLKRPVCHVLLEDVDVAIADAGADHHASALDVHALLDYLPPRQRAAIVERFLLGASIRDAAIATGNSEDGLKKLQSRALVRLRRVLEGGSATVTIRTIPKPNDPSLVDGFCTHCKAECYVSVDTLRCPTCGRMVDPLSLPVVPADAAREAQAAQESTTERSAMTPTPLRTQVQAMVVAASSTPAVQPSQQPRREVRLTPRREASSYIVATDKLIEALEAEEAAATADFRACERVLDVKRARVLAARRELQDMRTVRGIVTVGAPIHSQPGNEPAAAPTPGEKRWSRISDSCLACGRDTVRHMARGFCTTCYPKQPKLIKGHG